MNRSPSKRTILTERHPMFIWNFTMDSTMSALMEWGYNQAVGIFSGFFAQLGSMASDLFTLPWVQSIVLFFQQFAWALYVVGLAVSVFDTAIEYQRGRADLHGTALNALKGFFAVSLFSTLPVEMYRLSTSLQAQLSIGLTGYGSGDYSSIATGAVDAISQNAASMNDPLLLLLLIILIAYATLKVFFGNLKRGGILLIQIAVGSLYLFSVPRGYTEGAIGWWKQVVALCLTAFLQTTILVAGLVTLPGHLLIGLGLMLSAGEVPRIAGVFGLDTSTKASLSGAVHTVQSVINTTRSIITK